MLHAWDICRSRGGVLRVHPQPPSNAQDMGALQVCLIYRKSHLSFSGWFTYRRSIIATSILALACASMDAAA